MKIRDNFEVIMATLMLPLAYIYVCYMCETGLAEKILMGLFVLLFIVYAEVMYSKTKRNPESIIFLVATLVIGASFCFGIGRVWEDEYKIMFLHLFAVYYVISRSDGLAEDVTSHLFVWDGLNVLVIMPLTNFLLAGKTIAGAFPKEKKKSFKNLIFSLIAVVIGLILFVIVLNLLMDSDNNFESLVNLVKLEWDLEYILRIIPTLFVASFLYGMFGGFYKTSKDQIKAEGAKIVDLVGKLNKVSGMVWLGFICLFSLVYIVFFCLQGSYMLDAFSMLLPKTYTFSEYARKGFGEMCAVMVINFVLLWLTVRTSDKTTRVHRIFETILMGESLVFALIAFLKILMYINAYGFTPLRLQSVWLVVVLSYACICILFNMYTGRKSVRAWFIGSAISLAILTLI